MNFKINSFFFPVKVIVGSCFSLAAFTTVATAAPTSAVNPCPGIYYEEPHNSVRVVPTGCPPNMATRLRSEQGQMPGMPPLTQTQSNPLPLPEGQQAPIKTIALQAGRVNVRLKNTTGTQITYQAIGHTQQRSLVGGEEVLLQNMPAPLTITFLRPDAGLVKVTLMESSEPEVLGVMLNEALGLSDSQATLRIQGTGEVFTY